MDISVIDPAERARLVAGMPSGSDTQVAERLIERCDTLAEAEEIVRRMTPAFPAPQAVPPPMWANEIDGPWAWEYPDRRWARRVARSGEIAGRYMAIDAFQYVEADSDPVVLSHPGTNLGDIDGRELTPEQLADLGRWLIDAADAVRRAGDTLA